MLARLRIGLFAGLLTAAATGGALVGFGIARRSPLLPINAVAHLLLGSRALLFDGFDPLVTTTAVALHVLSVVIWAVLFALPVARLRAGLVWLSSLVFSAAAYLIDVRLLPESLRPGFERVLTTTELVSVYLLFAFSLAFAVLLMRTRGENEGERRDDLRRARDTGWLQNATITGDREIDPTR